MNIATEVWPTSKMLDINISVAMIWVGVCQSIWIALKKSKHGF